MQTNIMIPVPNEDDGSTITGLLDNLQALVPGVRVRWALDVTVDDPAIAQALERILANAGRAYQVLGQVATAPVTGNLVVDAATITEPVFFPELVPVEEYEPVRARPQRATLEPRACEYCQEIYQPKRIDQRCCGRPECRKAQRNYWNDQRVEQARAAREEQRREAMAPVAVESDDDQVGDGGQSAPDGAARGRLWSVLSGPRVGETISTQDLERSLLTGEFLPGTELEHPRLGKRRIHQRKGDAQQRLVVLSMQGANQ